MASFFEESDRQTIDVGMRTLLFRPLVLRGRFCKRGGAVWLRLRKRNGFHRRRAGLCARSEFGCGRARRSAGIRPLRVAEQPLAGFEPLCDGCAVCGAETARDPVLDTVQGVVHCRECGEGGGEKLPLSAACVTALEHILHGPDRKLYSFTLMPEDLRLLDRAAEGFAAAQLERSFRTLGYYKAILI